MGLQQYGFAAAVREGVRRWRVELMAARRGAVRWRRDEEKKETAPFPRFGVWGAPSVCVCVCVCVPLRCCVGGACVKGEDKGFLIYFFFTSLFSLSPPPPQSPHPYDTRRRGTPALSSLSFSSQCTKGTPPPRRGEKSPRDDTYFSFNISVPPRRPLFGVRFLFVSARRS